MSDRSVAPGLAFAHLNLRRNPFGEPERAERGALAVADERVADWIDRLRGPDFAIQFLGDQGRGKTTHLLALHRHHPTAPFVYVGEGERPRLPRGVPFFLDEAQRVSRRRRARLFRRGSIAIGSHEDHADELRAAGLDVVTVRPADELDTARLARIFARRIDWARRGPGAVPTIPAHGVRALHATHGSDVRAMERVLYRAFQGAREIGDVEL